MSKTDIVFAANSFEEMRRIPILPPELNIEHPWNNEEFETINLGTINLIGLPGLRTLSIESFFPVRPYPFAKDKRMDSQAIGSMKEMDHEPSICKALPSGGL